MTGLFVLLVLALGCALDYLWPLPIGGVSVACPPAVVMGVIALAGVAARLFSQSSANSDARRAAEAEAWAAQNALGIRGYNLTRLTDMLRAGREGSTFASNRPGVAQGVSNRTVGGRAPMPEYLTPEQRAHWIKYAPENTPSAYIARPRPTATISVPGAAIGGAAEVAQAAYGGYMGTPATTDAQRARRAFPSG